MMPVSPEREARFSVSLVKFQERREEGIAHSVRGLVAPWEMYTPIIRPNEIIACRARSWPGYLSTARHDARLRPAERIPGNRGAGGGGWSWFSLRSLRESIALRPSTSPLRVASLYFVVSLIQLSRSTAVRDMRPATCASCVYRVTRARLSSLSLSLSALL